MMPSNDTFFFVLASKTSVLPPLNIPVACANESVNPASLSMTNFPCASTAIPTLVPAIAPAPFNVGESAVNLSAS